MFPLCGFDLVGKLTAKQQINRLLVNVNFNMILNFILKNHDFQRAIIQLIITGFNLVLTIHYNA